MTVVIERGLFWLKTEMQRNRPLVDEVMELCRCGDWEAAAADEVQGMRRFMGVLDTF